MWQIVSNISSIVTCILFVLYVIGHIWKVVVTQNTRYEKFKVVPYNSDFDIDGNDNGTCMAVIKLLSKSLLNRRKPVETLGFYSGSIYSHSANSDIVGCI